MKIKGNNKFVLLFVVIITIVVTAGIIFVIIPRLPLQVDAGDVYECDIGEYIKFKGKAYGGVKPYNWSWDFNNDGIVDSYHQNPVYFYNIDTPGVVYAKLTVTDQQQNANTSTAYVYINMKLELGDIIYLRVKPVIQDIYEKIIGHPAEYYVHAAMYIGNDLFIESADYTFLHDTKIEEELSNIPSHFKKQYDPLTFDNISLNPLLYIFNLENGVQISHAIKLNAIFDQTGMGKVTAANMSQKMNVRKFIYSQLGKPYQWIILDEDVNTSRANPNITDIHHLYFNWTIPDDPYIDYWYCTEIIWAGYLHQNIQIDPEPVTDPQNEIETIFYNKSRLYFGSDLIDISRLPQWTRWKYF